MRLLALSAIALLLVACGDDDTNDAVGGTTTTAGAAADLGAPPTIGPDGRLVPGPCREGAPTDSDPDHGVTATSINVASVNVDFGPLVNIGFARDQGNTAEQFTKFFELANRKGICGRTLAFQALDFDYLANEGPQTCVKVTDDRKNLVVLGQEGFQDISCVAEDGQTVLYTQNAATEEQVEAAGGRMFVNPPSWDDQLDATARRFHEAGLLGGKVGVFYGGPNPVEGDIVEKALLPVLDELGVDHVDARTDGLVSDETGAAAARSAVTTFRNENVTTVLFAVGVSNHSGFLAEAKSQGFEPEQWLTVPMGGNTAATLFVERSDVEEQAEGERLTSYYNIDPDTRAGYAVACNRQWVDAGGEQYTEGSFQWWGVANVCSQVDMLVAALTMASPNLSQASFTAALERLPAFPIGRTISPVSFERSRNGSSQLRTLVYRADCNCYRNDGEPFAVG
jgi:hypothetical protein